MENPPPSKGLVYLGVAVAIASVSAAAIFIRMADAPALTVSFWRNAFAVSVLLPIALVRKDAFPVGRSSTFSLLAGVCLAAHFALWISSLDHTTVAASVVLVCTQPIFVAVLAWLVLKEKLSAQRALGIGVAFVGTLVIATGDGVSGGAFFGNALALGGAITVAVYVLFGRVVRASGIAITTYAVVVYGAAGVVLLLACLVLSVPLVGFSWETWFWIAMIGVFPQVLGHTLFNWALRYLQAAVLSGLILAEPVVSTVLAWVILDERPTTGTFVGGGVILCGLAVLVRADLSRPRPPRS